MVFVPTVSMTGLETFSGYEKGGVSLGRRLEKADWIFGLSTICYNSNLSNILRCAKVNFGNRRGGTAVPYSRTIGTEYSMAGSGQYVVRYGSTFLDA